MFKVKVYLLVGGMIASQVFCNMPVSATEKNTMVKDQIEDGITIEDDLIIANMSDDQLNRMIDNIYQANITTSVRSVKNTDSVKTAWRLAAQILRNNGYYCSATLMEYSLNGMNYKESEFASVQRTGVFSRTLPGSTAYSNYKSKVRNGKNPKGINFDDGDVADLHYSLGHVDTKVVSRAGTYTSLITDTYDFSYQNYEKLLTTLVNNAAWLSQHVGVFNPIDVSIYTVFK